MELKERLNYKKAAPGVYKAMLGLHEYLLSCGIDHKLLDLIYLRVSQINGCAFCIDMHWSDLKKAGEPDKKLYLLNAWKESPGFTERERAALEWAESLTLVSQTQAPDHVYDLVCQHFSDAELANLTLAVVTINGWNRLNVGFRTPPAN